MVRAAAKNFRDVLIVVDPDRLRPRARSARVAGGPSLELRFALAQKAFAHTAAYDTTIASTLGTISAGDG